MNSQTLDLNGMGLAPITETEVREIDGGVYQPVLTPYRTFFGAGFVIGIFQGLVNSLF